MRSEKGKGKAVKSGKGRGRAAVAIEKVAAEPATGQLAYRLGRLAQGRMARNQPEGPAPKRKTGPVQYLEKLLQVWGLNATEGAILLGADDASYVRRLSLGATRLDGRDAKDRVAHLFAIDEALSRLFRNDEVVREWLREPKRELGGKSALDVLLEGSMENMLLVKQFTEHLSGR
jgi:uncharacterized protein (DUF2384 family)